MAVDFKINLAKDLCSSAEQRERFHRTMVLYVIFCGLALIVSAYYSSINFTQYVINRQERSKLMMTTLAISGLDGSAFKNPTKTYDEVQKYSDELATLRLALGQRTQLLPVLHHLFKDLPDDVVLQNLSTGKGKLVFGLNMPPATEGANDSVRELKAIWERNEEIMKRVSSIRPVKGQRRTIGENSVFNVQFECVLKK